MVRICYQEEKFYTRGSELVEKEETFQIILRGPVIDRWRKKNTLGIDWPTAPDSNLNNLLECLKMMFLRPSMIPVWGLLIKAKHQRMAPIWEDEDNAVILTLSKARD